MRQAVGQKRNGAERVSEFRSQSSDKLLQIMECMMESHLPVKLQDISERLEMPQPTTLRYLNTLLDQQYVYKDEETLRYALTWKICKFAHNVQLNSSIRDIVSPFMRELCYTLDVGACLAKEIDGELVYLDVIDRPGNTGQILQRIGKGAPIHSTGSGKVLLSGMAKSQVELIAETRGLGAFTEKTITALPALLAELEMIRSKGYALDDEECELGIRCASVPLYDYTENIVAALSVFGPVGEVDIERICNVFVPELKEMAAQISMRLGSNRFS